MKLSGPTCSRKLNEDEKDVPREDKTGRAGWVRLERRVRRWELLLELCGGKIPFADQNTPDIFELGSQIVFGEMDCGEAIYI
jgi:hypothetical protein